MRQHRGKALLAAGRAQDAVADFERVVALRVDGDGTLLASAQQALRAAKRPRDQHGLLALPIVEFGFPGPMRDRLVNAIARGEKTATSSLLREYESSGDRVPDVGDCGAVIDSDGIPRFAIWTTAVDVVPLGMVSSAHALAEGEGFQTVAEWRDAHVGFWDSPDSRAELGSGFVVGDRTLVVLERFETVR
jgi:uncharacterized protein YhfF